MLQSEQFIAKLYIIVNCKYFQFHTYSFLYNVTRYHFPIGGVLMKLLSIGYNHLHDENFVVDRPNGIDTWLLLLVKTPAVFNQNGKRLICQKNSFVIFPADIPQYYTAYKEDYIDDWIHFYPTEEDVMLLKSLEIPLNKVTPVTNLTELTTLVRNMTYEFNSQNIYQDEILQLYFKILLYKISQQLNDKLPAENNMNSIYFQRMQALRNDIYSNPSVERSVDTMAEQLSMSRSAFQHNYKTIFGNSVLTDIINSRLRRVKFYLSTTDMPLNQIALHCGYHNEFHLIRQFKQHYGITPTKFRQQL